MSLFGPGSWLRSPRDRDVIRMWTVRPDEQQRYALELPSPSDPNEFEFLVLGDTGDSNFSTALSPQDAVAQQLAKDAAIPGSPGRAEIVIHLGDVVYMTGERRLYDRNFSQPYAPFLCPQSTPDNFIFRIPFLPVPGNHDYYDLEPWVKWLSRIPLLGSGLRRVIQNIFSFSFPEGGSDRGRAFMEAFIDLKAETASGPIAYRPGVSTRLPNRYYRFSFGNVDFFALDSNTLDATLVSRIDEARVRTEAEQKIKMLEDQAKELDSRIRCAKLACERGAEKLAETEECEEFPEEATSDACSMVRSLSEKALDIQRELAHQQKLLAYQPEDHDAAQLEWLRSGLDESLRERPQAWRVVYMHHPLWTTIGNHAESAETRAVRSNLLPLLRDRVHLILSGHAHAFEWLRAAELPNTGVFVSGGGGQISLRRSLLNPSQLYRHRDRYEALRRGGLLECCVSGRGPAAADGNGGPLYHYLRIAVTSEQLIVRPIGVRRVGLDYRAEAPMPTYHVPELPDRQPSWNSRLLESVTIRRSEAPMPDFV